MNQVAIVLEAVTAEHFGKVKVLNEKVVFTAASNTPKVEFLQNELVKICRVEDNIAYLQRGML